MIASMAATAALAAPSVDVNVSVTNLRNTKGQLMVCLTKNPKAFPDCTKDATALKKLVSASAGNVTFNNVAPGTYAVAIVHDENKNDKMDLRVFIPREGFGFSRNPKIGMGPPKFKSASFVVGESNVNQSVKMKYMF
jgi:uncharacterized protein (DUF2141 family)